MARRIHDRSSFIKTIKVKRKKKTKALALHPMELNASLNYKGI